MLDYYYKPLPIQRFFTEPILVAVQLYSLKAEDRRPLPCWKTLDDWRTPSGEGCIPIIYRHFDYLLVFGVGERGSCTRDAEEILGTLFSEIFTALLVAEVTSWFIELGFRTF